MLLWSLIITLALSLTISCAWLIAWVSTDRILIKWIYVCVSICNALTLTRIGFSINDLFCIGSCFLKQTLKSSRCHIFLIYFTTLIISIVVSSWGRTSPILIRRGCSWLYLRWLCLKHQWLVVFHCSIFMSWIAK